VIAKRLARASGYVTLLVCFLLPISVLAQAFVPLKGNGSVTIAYQYANVHDHFFGDGSRVQRGRIYSEGVILQADYGLTDAVAVSLAIPYIQARYSGVNPHNPANLNFPNNAVFLDDGTYHGSIQDLGFGIRYNVWARAVSITPFVNVTVPSHDYPFFAHSAIGRNLRQLSFGANVGGQIEHFLPNSYFHIRYAYAVPEKVEIEGASFGSNRSQIRLDFGHVFTERLSLRAIQIAQIAHGGLDQPNDYPDKTNELWFHHDQIDAISSLDVGGGADFSLSPSIDLSASLVHSVWGRNGHALRMGVVAGVTYSFPRLRGINEPSLTPAGHIH
jgi:hypothetical protein